MLTLQAHQGSYQKRGRVVARGLSLQERREVLAQIFPEYREASGEQKRRLLDRFTHLTGYHRTYACWLLNQCKQGKQESGHPRPRRYEADVKQALVFVWNAANRICAKRLIPFLPALLQALERHGHLHLSESCRAQLLAMSAATADRLLSGERNLSQRGKSTTRAGTLLKRQIPIRTFEQWNETTPGFLEADLVAHCGSSLKGTFLSTLTLTDIATGWTECFPLRSKSQQEVLAALCQVRGLFPFPILGLDTDSGSEFINQALFNYCQQHQITFTRSRPSFKNDQCFVEQKNGNIVRQVTGYNRMMGDWAYTQLGELYQALRLYVNVFQPSMKLQGKYSEGRKIHHIYDAAKTPLQRVLLSGIITTEKEQELERMARLLDPLRLFEHLQELQQTLFTSLRAPFLASSDPLSFCLQCCIGSSGTPNTETDKQTRKSEDGPTLPSHPITTGELVSSDSFVVIATRSSLQAEASSSQTRANRQRALSSDALMQSTSLSSANTACAPLGRRQHNRVRQDASAIPIEQAIGDYLEHEKSLHRRPKTLEWHAHALGLFQHYLLIEHHGVLPGQITEDQVRDWFLFLQEHPTPRGALRSASTVQSYARSVRAFCRWAVQKRYLSTSPFAHLSLPPAISGVPDQLDSEEWERLLQACVLSLESGERAEQATARNQAILWVLFDTGMQVAELCRLRIGDVDREQGIVNIGGKGTQARVIMLGQESLRALLIHLNASHRAGASDQEPLFLSGTGYPLTREAVALLFGRLRQRAGMTRRGVSASVLREHFAVRYLRTGGDPAVLQEILGIKDREVITRYQRSPDQRSKMQEPKEKQEDPLSHPLPRSDDSREHERGSSPSASTTHQQQSGGKPFSSTGETAPLAKLRTLEHNDHPP